MRLVTGVRTTWVPQRFRKGIRTRERNQGRDHSKNEVATTEVAPPATPTIVKENFMEISESIFREGRWGSPKLVNVGNLGSIFRARGPAHEAKGKMASLNSKLHDGLLRKTTSLYTVRGKGN